MKYFFLFHVMIEFENGLFFLYDNNPSPAIFYPNDLLCLLNALNHFKNKIKNNPSEQFNIRIELPTTDCLIKRHLYAYNQTHFLCWLVNYKIESQIKQVNCCLNFDLLNENIDSAKQFVYRCLNAQ